MITFYGGGLPHFVNHIYPIYAALPDSIKGKFHARGRAATRAVELGLDPIRVPPRKSPLVVVASYEDHRAVAPSPTVLVNHGIGQTYKADLKVADHPSYSGGRDRDRVVLHLCPSARDAAQCKGLTAVVGTPYLDRFLPAPLFGSAPVRKLTVNNGGTIAISFHADIHICPETRWVFPYYKDAIVKLVKSNQYNIIGHSHPRMIQFLEPFWRRLGVPFYPHWEDVLDEADLYICDNSSTMYEAAAIGIPVLALNAPWYRRKVHHGLRFWDAIPGWSSWDPDHLAQDIDYVRLDGPRLRHMRKQALDIAYAGVALDGKATERAVNALIGLVSDGRYSS